MPRRAKAAVRYSAIGGRDVYAIRTRRSIGLAGPQPVAHFGGRKNPAKAQLVVVLGAGTAVHKVAQQRDEQTVENIEAIERQRYRFQFEARGARERRYLVRTALPV